MSYPDYTQTSEDHQTVLILVDRTGKNVDNKTFNKTWERIRKLRCVKVPGHNRKIWLRFKRAYPIENNEWGDFQAHRKVLGILSIGSCSAQTDFETLFSAYKKVKQDYSSTIFNSRLIAFGLNCDGTPLQEINSTNTDDSSDVSETDESDGNRPSAKFTIGHMTPSSSDGSVHDILGKNDNSKSTVSNNSTKVKVPLAKAESFDSLSETTTPKNEKDKTERNNTPSEKVNGQKDSRNSEANLSRPHSNSLTNDSRGSEIVFYPNTNSCEDLEERVQEFASSLFFVLESKRLDRSFERSDKMQLLCTPFEKKDFIGVDTDTRSYKKRCQGRLRKHLADLSLQAGLPGEAILHYQTALDMLKSVNDWLWIGACYEGLSSASVLLANPQSELSPFKRNLSFSVKRAVSLNDAKQKTVTGGSNSIPNGMDLTRESKGGLNPDDVIEKYKEALINYSKYKQAGVIEMEASLKACRVLISQQKYLHASDFLKNVVFISVTSVEEDKVHKYSSLAALYTQIGFHRKASFFKRIAAMQCVAPQVHAPLWNQCHHLLLQSLDGFSISLDTREFQTGSLSGWPVLQLRVLNELIFSARKMSNPQLTVRHLSFLLHTMHDHMSAAERREMGASLEAAAALCEGVPQPLAIDNGLILPPVALTRLPTVKSFKPMPLAPHLEPIKLVPKTPVMEAKSDSPFIYSPFIQNNNNNSTKNNQKSQMLVVDFQWVAGDSCDISMLVFNPMPDDLKVSHMGILSDGVDIDCLPATPVLPAESGPCQIKLTTTPKTSGEINILGYSIVVFGVRSVCKLKDIPSIEGYSYQIDVTPALPQLHLVTSLPKSASFFTSPEGANIVTSGTTALYAGQSEECTITLQNVGSLPIETVEVSLEDKYNTGILESVFSWNKENIVSQLPLQPGAIGCFTLYLHGTNDFISNQNTEEGSVVSPVRSFWGLKNVRSGTVTSLDGSSSDTVCLETLLQVQYSGGPGLEAGYCRQSSVALTVDIQPSLAFCKWDVLQADSPEFCHLVLDGRNESSHTMALTYNTDKSITIEANQVRRFAVLLRRINFTSTTFTQNSENDGKDVDTKLSAVIASYVDIQWTIPKINVSGRASLEHLSWSPRQLELLQAPILDWDVQLNSGSCDATGVFLSSGDVVSVQVQVSPKTDVPDLGSFSLSIQCYQDSANGCHDYNMADKVVVMGTNFLPLHEIDCDNGYKHDCDFVFLTEGRYYLEIKCIMGNSPSVGNSELTTDLENYKWTLSPAPQVIVGKNHLDFLSEDSGNLEAMEVCQRSRSASRSSDGCDPEVVDNVQCFNQNAISVDKVLRGEDNFHNISPEVAS